MKVIQIGIGVFGLNWLRNVILPSEDVELIGIVEHDRSKWDKIESMISPAKVTIHQSLDEALHNLEPDFLLNLTPPHIHKEIIFQAMDKRIPILSEKPVAESFAHSKAIYERTLREGSDVVIAENFRYTPIFRKAKELIEAGTLGKIDSISIDFFRKHQMENYHMDFKQPLLLDVTIHHLDLVRYLTGKEAVDVCGRGWNPQESP